MLSPNELVKEVSKLVSKGFICYVHRESREVISIRMDEVKQPENKLIIAEIEEKIGRYIKCEPMPTQKMLWTMQAFLLEMTDDDLRRELNGALNRKKPTRNFLQILESRPDIKQHWILFSAEQYEEYVAELFIKDYNY